MADQRLHSPERNRVPCDADVPEEIKRRILSALELDAEHPAGVIALLFENALLFGIGEQRRVDDLAQSAMPYQGFCDALRIFALSVHPQRNRGEAAIEKPAFVR